MVDLSVCAQEPIHIPGMVEPHGVLIVAVGPDLEIVQVSGNTAGFIGIDPAGVLNQPLREILSHSSFRTLETEIRRLHLEANPIRILDLDIHGQHRIFDATLHRLHGLLYLELEPRAGEGGQASHVSYQVMTNTLAELRGAVSLADLCQLAAAYIRDLTGFDRVMVYRFLEDDSGEVIAEDCRDDLSPYLGLRYPASDIPAQARQLYIRNPIRLKPEVGVPGVAMTPTLNPVTGQPLDMSFCMLRRMSPVHEEYLRNMGVVASMSLSIIQENRLWGLIACHHTEARFVTHATRVACEFLTEFLSSQIGAKEEADMRELHARVDLKGQLLEDSLRRAAGVPGLFQENPDELLSVMHASGCAAFIQRRLLLAGDTPASTEVQSLMEWLTVHQNQPVLTTNRLQDHYGPAAGFVETASGLTSLRITKTGSDFFLWFRPEALTTILWGGNPEKPVELHEGSPRISPRQSFEKWKQGVAGQAAPWLPAERRFAASFRNIIAEVMLTRQNEEITRLNTELSRSNIELDTFAYAASHDLQEPIRTIRTYAELVLRAESAGSTAPNSEFLRAIVSGADRMTSLVRGLLDYAGIGGMERVSHVAFSLEEVLAAAIESLNAVIQENQAIITCDPLPCVLGDALQIRQVFQNLITNALRYRSAETPRVHISTETAEGRCIVHVRDNGGGFNQAFAEQIFKIFKRLHGREVSGSGVGLAICKKIVEQHGGTIEAQSAEGKGAVFSFTLPLVQ